MRINGPTPYSGFNGYLMQSDEYTDKLISEFEKVIAAGYNPNEAYQYVFDKVGCTERDLTAADKKRLQKRVEEIYRSNHSH